MVLEVKSFNGRTTGEVIKLAAVAEKFSEHAIANAILKRAGTVGLNVEDPDHFETSTGHGVEARRNDERIVVGNRSLREEKGFVFEEPTEDYLTSQEIQGRTAVLVTLNSEIAGVISVSDELREGVASIIREIKRNGVKKVVMLTGDNRSIAEKVSEQASIDETWAELLPEEKVEYVKNYQSQGHKVAMIGDGVNDAPALTVADVGIAMGVTGTDVAIETAGIVLTTDDLNKVSRLIGLSRGALSVIKQNILFALAVNILGIFFSTQGIITPVTASIIHESSALIVVFNALRLATKKAS